MNFKHNVHVQRNPQLSTGARERQSTEHDHILDELSL